MAQRSEDGVGKTSEMSERLERAIAVWTRSAISDSLAAYAALAVFGLCAVIGAIHESRNRRLGRHESNGLDLSDGGE